MNKKVIGILIAVIAIIVVTAGGVYILNNNTSNENNNAKPLDTTAELKEKINNETTENEKIENSSSTGKILIAYFSRADENYSVGTVEVGNTEIMAGFIKDYLGNQADTFKIDPVVSYPANYKKCTEVATDEKNSNARPEYKNANDLDISDYDTIFIGYPIWWGDVPMIINTFIEKYDFSGKTIIPFCTHEGSGNAGTFNSLRNKMSSSKVNTKGLTIRGAEARKESSRSTVENWLKDLKF